VGEQRGSGWSKGGVRPTQQEMEKETKYFEPALFGTKRKDTEKYDMDPGPRPRCGVHFKANQQRVLAVQEPGLQTPSINSDIPSSWWGAEVRRSNKQKTSFLHTPLILQSAKHSTVVD